MCCEGQQKGRSGEKKSEKKNDTEIHITLVRFLLLVIEQLFITIPFTNVLVY